MLKTMGAPTYLYPTGEHLQRQLGDEFGKAMKAYEAGDNDAYNEFFDNNPEFANRLSLWDEPEDRMRNFLVDDVWNMYSEMPDVNKRIIRETLGDEFQLRFLDENTRNYQAIPIEQLQMWSKMMGGDPPGTLSEAFPINLAPPVVANQAQIFYDTRNQTFPEYYMWQQEYYSLAEGKPRREYLKQNPQLAQYWGWRRDFLKRNPSVAPYIDDNFEPKYSSVQEMEQAWKGEPSFTRYELARYLGDSSVRILIGVYTGKMNPPQDVVDYLTEKAEAIGLTYEELVARAGQSE